MIALCYHVPYYVYKRGRNFVEHTNPGGRTLDPLEASRLITDDYAVKILVTTFKKPCSVQELSRKLGIPIAACYRKVKELEDASLLACAERKLTQKGKRVNMYISQLKNAYIFFEKGKLRVRFHLSTGAINDFGGAWSVVDILGSDKKESRQ